MGSYFFCLHVGKTIRLKFRNTGTRASANQRVQYKHVSDDNTETWRL